MTNAEKAARLDGMADKIWWTDDAEALRAGAKALLEMDDAKLAEPGSLRQELADALDLLPDLEQDAELVKCGTFTEQVPLGPVVRVDRGLWKQIREQRDASQREVERLRQALRSINRIDENGNAVLNGWSEIDDIICAALSGIDTPPPDQRDEALERAEKALKKVESYLNRVNHVHLLDGSILYASEVFDALAAIRAARGGR